MQLESLQKDGKTLAKSEHILYIINNRKDIRTLVINCLRKGGVVSGHHLVMLYFPAIYPFVNSFYAL